MCLNTNTCTASSLQTKGHAQHTMLAPYLYCHPAGSEQGRGGLCEGLSRLKPELLPLPMPVSVTKGLQKGGRHKRPGCWLLTAYRLQDSAASRPTTDIILLSCNSFVPSHVPRCSSNTLCAMLWLTEGDLVMALQGKSKLRKRYAAIKSLIQVAREQRAVNIASKAPSPAMIRYCPGDCLLCKREMN